MTTNSLGDEKRESKARRCCKFLDTCGLFELSCVFLSTASIVTIVLTLQMCNGQPQPHWIISLNTTVSFLAIFAKFGTAGLLSNGIGQLKWIWFSDRPRRLKDVETFDSASRGELWANCKLPAMQKFKYVHKIRQIQYSAKLMSNRTIATLGCIAFLIGVGFEPFTQNLVRYETKQVVDTSKPARLTNSTVYHTAGPILTNKNETLPPSYSVDPALKANAYSSVFSNDPSRPWAVPKYTCSSGNCTWGAVETLGVRALCSDLTHLIYRDCDDHYCGARIEGGPGLYFLSSEKYAGVLVINVTTTFRGIIYTNATLPVLQYIMVKDAGSQVGNPFGLGPEQPLVATECSLEVCVQSSKSSVSEGIYKESNIDYWCRPSSHQDNRNITLVPYRHLRFGNQIGGRRFELSYPAWQSITWFLRNIFDSSLYADKKNTWYVMSQIESLYAPVDIGQSIFYGNYSQCSGTNDHLTCVARNMAMAMTKSFRDSAYIAHGLDGADMAIGDTMIAATLVYIDWAWLTLPLLIWLLSVVLWAATAWQTRKRKLPLWRNNPLTLVHLLGRKSNADGQSSPRASITKEERPAKDDYVQLHVTVHDTDLV